MTKQEFDRIVKDAVDNGADRKDAEAYVTRGFKLPVDTKGNPVFTTEEAAAKAPAKKAASKPRKRVNASL